MDDEFVDGEGIGRFVVPQGRFTPILSEIRKNEVLDCGTPDTMLYAFVSTRLCLV